MEDNLKKGTDSEKKCKVYSAIKICIFFMILFSLIFAAAKVTERKDSVKKYSDFMQLSEQIDVLFFGSSHMVNGISPLQLYAEYGITSYNMAKSGGLVTESYWMLMNALDYCTPKCVVVDLWALDRNYRHLDTKDGTESVEDCSNAISLLHDNMDFWPMSKTKIAAINDLIGEYEVRKEFYWDFITYHDRWSSLNADDFRLTMGKSDEQSNLGAKHIYMVEPKLEIYQPEKMTDIISDDIISVQYLRKILDECESRNIEVILTFLPMAYSYEQDWMAVNTVEKIATERNVQFLNLLPHDSQNIINFRTDMCDETHVNNNGMRKLTSFLGKYLCEIEGIEDRRQDPAYQIWNDKVSLWQGSEIQRVLNESDLYLELGMIHNLNANAVIFMRGNSQALQDSLVQEFLMQLAGSTAVLEAAKCGGPYLLIRDATSGVMQIQEFVGEQQSESFRSIFGDTYYIALKDFAAIYVDGNLEYNYLDMEKHYTSEVQISIMGQEGEIMSRLFYDPNWNYMVKEAE